MKRYPAALAVRFGPSLLALLLLAGCGKRQAQPDAAPSGGPSCRSAEGIALLFEPTRGTMEAAPAIAAKAASIAGAQLVIGERTIALLVAGSTTQEGWEKARKDIIAQARALDLEFTVEDAAAIDETCTVRLRHPSAASHGGVVTPRP